MFHQHFVGYAIKVRLAIAREFADLIQSTDDTIDCFVGEIFSFNAAATAETFYEATPNLFILQGRTFAIRVEPGKQRIKRFLRQNPVFIQMTSNGSGTENSEPGVRTGLS